MPQGGARGQNLGHLKKSFFFFAFIFLSCNQSYLKNRYYSGLGGRTGLMVRPSDSGSGDPGSILGRVGVFVSLSKRHLLPKSTGNTQE